MTKAELVDVLAQEAGVTKSVANSTFNALIDAITKSVKKGQKVSIIGFGTFSQTKRKARTARNPRTGEPIKIKACKAPKFTAGKTFKDAVK